MPCARLQVAGGIQQVKIDRFPVPCARLQVAGGIRQVKIGRLEVAIGML